MRKKLILMDFDGVIHDTRGIKWCGVDVVKGQLVPNIKEVIKELRKTFTIYVYSSRCLESKGKTAIIDYLDFHGVEVDSITDRKLNYASIIIDDRAINFDGDTLKLLDNISNFKVWTSDTIGKYKFNYSLKKNKSDNAIVNSLTTELDVVTEELNNIIKENLKLKEVISKQDLKLSEIREKTY